MAWFYLIGSGAFEAVWAIALSKSEGFTKLWPSVIFFGALIVSMGGLAIALRDIPVGTGYAIWVSIGAVITVVYAMATGAEAVSIAKILLIMGIIGCVVGLKIVS